MENADKIFENMPEGQLGIAMSIDKDAKEVTIHFSEQMTSFTLDLPKLTHFLGGILQAHMELALGPDATRNKLFTDFLDCIQKQLNINPSNN